MRGWRASARGLRGGSERFGPTCFLTDMFVIAQTAAKSRVRLWRMTRHQNDWQPLLAEYALTRVVYQLARAAVARQSHNKDTMTAALLIEDQARERLVEVRRRICKARPLRNRPSPFCRTRGARTQHLAVLIRLGGSKSKAGGHPRSSTWAFSATPKPGSNGGVAVLFRTSPASSSSRPLTARSESRAIFFSERSPFTDMFGAAQTGARHQRHRNAVLTRMSRAAVL